MWLKMNPTAELQPATHFRRFKMLNAPDMVGIQSFRVWRCEEEDGVPAGIVRWLW